MCVYAPKKIRTWSTHPKPDKVIKNIRFVCPQCLFNFIFSTTSGSALQKSRCTEFAKIGACFFLCSKNSERRRKETKQKRTVHCVVPRRANSGMGMLGECRHCNRSETDAALKTEEWQGRRGNAEIDPLGLHAGACVASNDAV